MNALQRSAAPVDIEALVARRAVGFSLEAAFYTDPEIYRLDLSRIFGRHWLFCATEAQIPEPGDYVTMDVGSYSVILVRDDDGAIRAHHNVCRHRGFRVLGAARGSVANIVCPYHQWTYRTDGALIFAESQAPTFEMDCYGLKPVQVRTLAGLVFVHLGEQAPDDFAEMASVLEPYLEPYDLRTTKVAHQAEILQGGNWKIVLENNRECRYNEASHPDLSTSYFPVFGYSENDIPPQLRPVFERYLVAADQLASACADAGFPRDELREIDTRVTGFHISHHPLDGEGSSFGPHAEPLCARRMGSIGRAAFGDLSLKFQPNAWFHFLSDHAVLCRALPVGPTETVLQTTWLVHRDAVAGVDYDVEALTRSWRVTNDQDTRLIAGAQAGVENPAYEPGPYSLFEDDIEACIRWYVARLSASDEDGVPAATRDTAGAR